MCGVCVAHSCVLFVCRTAVARSLINKGKGAGVDTADGDRLTPLMLSAQHGRVESCRVLIEAGATVDAAKGNDWTSLMLAANAGKVEVCRVLVEVGNADVNRFSSPRPTPIDGKASPVRYLADPRLSRSTAIDLALKAADGHEAIGHNDSATHCRSVASYLRSVGGNRMDEILHVRKELRYAVLQAIQTKLAEGDGPPMGKKQRTDVLTVENAKAGIRTSLNGDKTVAFAEKDGDKVLLRHILEYI